MNLTKDTFQYLWTFLRPVSQRRISMVCTNFYKWRKEMTVPDLNELLIKDNISDWIAESKIRQESPRIFEWRWRDDLVSITIRFIKFLQVIDKSTIIYIPYFIKTQYLASNDPDYSYAQMSFCNRNIRGGVFGKKLRNLPKDKYTEKYRILRQWIIKHRVNKYFNKLYYGFPRCQCLVKYGLIPEVLSDQNCSNCNKDLKGFR